MDGFRTFELCLPIGADQGLIDQGIDEAFAVRAAIEQRFYGGAPATYEDVPQNVAPAPQRPAQAASAPTPQAPRPANGGQREATVPWEYDDTKFGGEIYPKGTPISKLPLKYIKYNAENKTGKWADSCREFLGLPAWE